MATSLDEENSLTLLQLTEGTYPLAEDAQIIGSNGRITSIDTIALPHRCRLTLQLEEEGLSRVVRIRPLHR